MKVLVINWHDWTHPRSGGAEIHLRETFTRLVDAGHRVDLLCAGGEDLPGEERLQGITVIRRGSRATFNWTVPRVYRRVLAKNGYDVIVDDLNKIPFFSPLFADRPVVALVHHLFGGAIFQETNPLFGGYVWFSERPLPAVYADSPFIAVSPSTAADLAERGVQPERITVIPNGLPEIDVGRLLEIPKTQSPLFVYLGRLKRYKRVDLLIDAFARVVVETGDATLVVAGDGDHREALEARAAELGLGHRILFPGWVEENEKWHLLREAWALGYTSPKEGWGIVSLEAQRVGTIAIVSDTPGLRDTVVDGETGRVVPHGDVTALAEAMLAAIRLPGERGRMEIAAMERAADFTWKAAAAATERVLAGAVENGRR